METFYISHPFSGNIEDNVEHSIEIQKQLIEKHSEHCFVNPLVMFDGTEMADDCQVSPQEYCPSLAYTLEVLSRCDCLVLCDGWENSSGCKAEYAFALQQGIPILYLDSLL